MRPLAFWMRSPDDGRWHWPRVIVVVVTLLVIVATVAWLTLWRPAARTTASPPAQGSVSVSVAADEGISEQRYALYATLVRGERDVVWTKAVPAGEPFQVDGIGKGNHLLALTVSPCVKRDCSTFRGGSSIGSVPVSNASSTRLEVRVSCSEADAPRGQDVPATGIAMLDCSRSTIEQDAGESDAA